MIPDAWWWTFHCLILDFTLRTFHVQPVTGPRTSRMIHSSMLESLHHSQNKTNSWISSTTAVDQCQNISLEPTKVSIWGLWSKVVQYLKSQRVSKVLESKVLNSSRDQATQGIRNSSRNWVARSKIHGTTCTLHDYFDPTILQPKSLQPLSRKHYLAALCLNLVEVANEFVPFLAPHDWKRWCQG